MGVLDALNDRTEQLQETGDATAESGEEKVVEAGDFKSVLDSLEKVDEESQEIIDTAIEGARETSVEVIDNTVHAPMESVSEGLSEVTEEATEDAETEHGNADALSDAPGDYGAVAAQAESGFEQRGAGFEASAESAQELNDEFKEREDDIARRVEEMW